MHFEWAELSGIQTRFIYCDCMSHFVLFTTVVASRVFNSASNIEVVNCDVSEALYERRNCACKHLLNLSDIGDYVVGAFGNVLMYVLGKLVIM